MYFSSNVSVQIRSICHIQPFSLPQVSARDPIFYRWHAHIEDIVQQYRDTRLPAYKTTGNHSFLPIDLIQSFYLDWIELENPLGKY